MQSSPFHGCGEQDPEDGAPSPRQWQWQGQVLGLLIQCSFSATSLNARRGQTAGRPVSPFLPLLAQHPQRHDCPRPPTPVTAQPWGWEHGHSLLCFRPGTPRPFPAPAPGLSLQSGWGQDKPGCGAGCSIPAKGSSELGESRLEPSGVLTCAPAFRLQGIARVELLDEGVAVLPADDAAGEETGGSQKTTPGKAPVGPLDLGVH